MKKYYTLLLIISGSFFLLFGKCGDTENQPAPRTGNEAAIQKPIRIRLIDESTSPIRYNEVNYTYLPAGGEPILSHPDESGIIALPKVNNYDIISLSHPGKEPITIVLKNTYKLSSLNVYLQNPGMSNKDSIEGNVSALQRGNIVPVSGLRVFDFDFSGITTYTDSYGNYRLMNNIRDNVYSIGFKRGLIPTQIYLITNPPNPKLDVVFDDTKDTKNTAVDSTQKTGSGN
jgi:hypothetical protein